MKDSTKRNLQLYSSFALSCIIGNPILSKGQVIYNDINPDQIVLDGDEFYLDLDSDGNSDFRFSNSANSVYTLTSATFIHYYLEGIWAVAFDDNGIYTNRPPSGFDSRYYPVAMEQNEIVDDLLHFETWPWQRMAWRKYVYGWNGYSTTSHYCCAGGYWFPEQTDKYLGIRFADAAGLRHYGWIRCDVKDDGRTLIVKDYAYEETPEKGILAGDTLGLYVAILDSEPGIKSLQIFPNPAKNNIFIQSETDLSNAMISISDLTGKTIQYSAPVSMGQHFYQVPMADVAKGIYLLQVITPDGAMFSQKIMKE